MKNDKNKNTIVTLLVIIILILTILIILLSSKVIRLKNNELTNTNIVQENNNTNQLKENDDYNFIRETKTVLVKEPECTEKSTSLIAYIKSNGNIAIEQNNSEIEIKVGNAKYLYSTNILACTNYILYFITDDKELYFIDSNTIDQEVTKATDSKVIEFLGEESNDNGFFIKVLLENGSIEYIKYFDNQYNW